MVILNLIQNMTPPTVQLEIKKVERGERGREREKKRKRQKRKII